MNKGSRFDVASLGLLIFLVIISIPRLNYFPQFVDGYYHLSVANGFIQSGGWVGWDWWCFAPFGRPHLYPPLYHLILVFLQSIGISGLNSLRITEFLITSLFLFFVWYVTRELVNERFSFINLLILSSFLPFYSSILENIPASLAIIFGLLNWFFIKKKKFISSTLFLALTFYTHSGISWIFCFSVLFLVLFNREYRVLCLKIICASLFLASPILYHQIKYLDYLDLKILGEVKFINFSIFIIFFGLFSLPLHIRKKDFSTIVFWGYLLGSICMFAKYPYRFFCAQGVIGLSLFASLLLERVISVVSHKKAVLLLAIIIPYLFFSHATFGLDKGKIKLNLLNSTFYNLLTGKIYNFFKFKSLFVPRFFNPILEVIQKNTNYSDIISSNIDIIAQIFSALTQRPSSNSLFGEVTPSNKFSYQQYAKIIIWVKLPIDDEILNKEGYKWKKIYENDVAYVFLNPNYVPSVKIVKSRINFKFIFLISLLIPILLIKDNINRAKFFTFKGRF